MSTSSPRYRIVDFDQIPAVNCPCGTAKRAFADEPDSPTTVHVTQITEEARTHYHKRQTETYYILECEPGAQLQLDEEIIPVHAGLCVLIPPGVRHRGIGRMRIINIVIPKFDPEDEYFD
ncbi:cupin domain-containing protein [Planctomicrobium sp. SH661]|uniref:cupin domain-containing protein n=1 Tax=Planctomicrobium sp. SH661 TaxID=3448124 RepID=UPI003F5C8A6E